MTALAQHFADAALAAAQVSFSRKFPFAWPAFVEIGTCEDSGKPTVIVSFALRSEPVARHLSTYCCGCGKVELHAEHEAEWKEQAGPRAQRRRKRRSDPRSEDGNGGNERAERGEEM